jgi:serine O-acetyltransferase
VEAVIGLLLELFFPGYYGRTELPPETMPLHVTTRLAMLRESLLAVVESAFCFAAERAQTDGAAHAHGECQSRARAVSDGLLASLGAIRDRLVLDAQAAYDGDPAAGSIDEIVLAYPGFLAVAVHRVAHALWAAKVPLVPRMMTEWAHARTGADLHPGAEIGPSFFIDHATGVVIGETSRIGRDVKLYQGVTLGAISHPKDAEGRVIRDQKRHPTVEDGVTIYANATILGGTTVVGARSVVGGSVFLTKSIPAQARVGARPPELRVIAAGTLPVDEPFPLEFEI